MNCVHEAICLRAENSSGYCSKGIILSDCLDGELDAVFDLATWAAAIFARVVSAYVDLSLTVGLVRL